MSAKRILEAVRTLTSVDEMKDKIDSYQDTIRTLIERVEQLVQRNDTLEQKMAHLFKKLRCADCNHYLESKLPGDTIVAHDCSKVVLTHCWGTYP